VFVELPDVGTEVAAGDKISEVESTKSVSDIFAPIAGTVVAVNGDLADEPQRLNEDPYGEGWICEIRPAEGVALDELLSATAYRDLVEA
jgi:glycine cleavage system H protein